MAAPHLCHMFSTFATGGPQVRTASIIDALDGRFRHTIVALDNNFAASKLVSDSASVQFVAPPPGKGGAAYSLTLRRLLKQLRPDLLVTYNWGAMDGVIAAQIGRVCPVVHTEDGFGPDEASALKKRRVLVRRWALRFIAGTVVPSKTLQRIATEEYRLPSERVFYIPNGIDVARFTGGSRDESRRALGIPANALVIGSVGALRPEKNLSALIEAFASLTVADSWLVIAGDGPSRPGLQETAARLGVADRVRFSGHVSDTPALYSALDIFAMSSSTEQLPMALLEAMASGLPCLCTDVGDSADALGTRNAPEIVPPHAPDAYRSALSELASSPAARQAIGARNRERCTRYYSGDDMVRRYADVYEAGIGRSYQDRFVPAPTPGA